LKPVAGHSKELHVVAATIQQVMVKPKMYFVGFDITGTQSILNSPISIPYYSIQGIEFGEEEPNSGAL